MTYALNFPRQVQFGSGQLVCLGQLVDSLGAKRALLVHGPHTAAAGIASMVNDALGPRVVAVFSDSHSPTDEETCEAVGAAAFLADVDVVVSVGGGSAIDAAKCAVDRLGAQIPLVAIPTTFSGAELTLDCGIVDKVTKTKRILRGSHLVASGVIYDPDLLNRLPDTVLAGSAMNSLAHCVEALYTPLTNRFIQSVAMGAARQLIDGLRGHFHSGGKQASYGLLLDGSFGAGLAQGNAGIALHHAICHYVGPQLGVAHGTANSIILPHVMQFNLPAVRKQFAELARALGAGSEPEDAVEAVRDIHKGIGLPYRLVDLGLTNEVARSIARCVVASPQIKNNPRQVTEGDILSILSAAS